MDGEVRLDVLQEMDSRLLHELRKEQTNMRANPISRNKTKIQKVPEIMQRNKDFEKYYKPTELSIGPLYAAEANLFKMKLKVKLAAEFIEGSNLTPDFFLEKILENIEDLKTCFDDGVITSYNNERLAKLLFLDGCAILEFIQSYLGKWFNKFGISNSQAALIKEDLFLLENQIPFKVLNLLIDLKQDSLRPRLRNLVRSFVLQNKIMAEAPDSKQLLVKPDSNYAHLLDVLRSVLLIPPDDHKKSTLSNCFSSLSSRVLSCWTQFYNWFACWCCWILCLYTFCIGTVSSYSACCDKICSCVVKMVWEAFIYTFNLHIRRLFGISNRREYQTFRNVQELKAAGIKLKASDSGSLKDISFQTRCFFRGQLKLPRLIVDNSTARKLLNLIAFEMCCHDYESKCEVTSYISLLDLLIDSEEDVKDLRTADILQNHLSSDADVAKLFNQIGSNCLAPPNDTYCGTKNDIDKHYKRKSTIWMAQLNRTHFSSPWTVLTLLAAITILLLTAIQTWYAVHPKN